MKKKGNLTDAQQKYYDSIVAYFGRYSKAPTAFELGLMNDATLQAAQKHIKVLADKGWITVEPNIARGITIL